MTKFEDPVLPSDLSSVRYEILKLKKLGYKMTRPSRHHLKIGSINYFPSTGTITSDPCYRHTERGFEALLRILDNVSAPAQIKNVATSKEIFTLEPPIDPNCR
jgi:hypothetical protein